MKKLTMTLIFELEKAESFNEGNASLSQETDALISRLQTCGSDYAPEALWKEARYLLEEYAAERSAE